MKWTATKTSRLTVFRRGSISHKQILGNNKLRTLQNLRMWEEHVDVSVFTSLENLKYLDLSFTEVLNASAFPQLSNLESLDLSETSVVEVSSWVDKLTNLTSLNLSWTKVANVSALAKLTSLKSLNLHDAELLNVSTLPKLPNLESLDLTLSELLKKSLSGTRRERLVPAWTNELKKLKIRF